MAKYLIKWWVRKMSPKTLKTKLEYRQAVVNSDELAQHIKKLQGKHKFVVKRLSGGCDHNWVSARNEVITSGLYCPKCNSVKAEENNDDQT